MKLKFKFQKKHIKKLMYLLLVIVNIIILFYLYAFVKNNIIQAISPYDPMYINESSITQNFNMRQFDEIIQKLDQKTKQEADNKKINDIFN